MRTARGPHRRVQQGREDRRGEPPLPVLGVQPGQRQPRLRPTGGFLPSVEKAVQVVAPSARVVLPNMRERPLRAAYSGTDPDGTGCTVRRCARSRAAGPRGSRPWDWEVLRHRGVGPVASRAGRSTCSHSRGFVHPRVRSRSTAARPRLLRAERATHSHPGPRYNPSLACLAAAL